MEKNQLLIRRIFRWYRKHGRDLPWRHTYDPYHILVSEVMLQQTQVERVVPKYTAWMHQFPTIESLASAKTGDVIRAWAGLGYNRRALFLQRTAQTIVREHKGIFPADLGLLKQLPGIGDYTARAVLSFAFDAPVAVLDTNHRKFYRRTFFHDRSIPDKKLLVFADAFIKDWYGRTKKKSKPNHVYRWNQAIMDFMSAVSSATIHDPTLTWYRETFPISTKKVQKKIKTIPFRDTDRFIRGRIVALLRIHGSLALRRAQKEFGHSTGERFQRIIVQLEKEGLVVRQKKMISLP